VGLLSNFVVFSSDGDIAYAVERDMDPDMEDEYEKFIAESDPQLLSNRVSSSWSSVCLAWLHCCSMW